MKHLVQQLWIPFSIIGIGLSSCQPTQSTQSSLDVDIPVSEVGSAQLGQAYDTRIGKLFEYSCITGTTTVSGGLESQIDYHQDMTMDQFKREFDFDFGFSFGAGGMSLSPELNFAQENAVSRLSTTQTVVVRVNGRSEILDPGSLAISANGDEAVRRFGDNVYQWCGNDYIQRIDYGASLVATLKYSFESESDKDLVGSKLGVGFGGGVAGFFDMIGIRLGIRTMRQKARERTKVEIRGIQLGGQPENLTAVLPDSQISCTLDDVEPCLAAFDKVLAYAKNDFPRQLESLDRLNPVRYVTAAYKDAGAPLLALHESLFPSVERENVIVKIQELQQGLDDSLNDFRQAKKLLRDSFISDEKRLRLMEINNLSQANALALEASLRLCRSSDPINCLNETPSIQNYDRGILLDLDGQWRERWLSGQTIKLVFDNLGQMAEGDSRTQIILQERIPGFREEKITKPAEIANRVEYLIRLITREDCQFPDQSKAVADGCQDERHSDQTIGFTAHGLNALLHTPMAWTYFNADFSENQFSIWGFVFRFDPKTGDVFDLDQQRVGRLYSVSSQR